jgi:hypothetical protein
MFPTITILFLPFIRLSKQDGLTRRCYQMELTLAIGLAENGI